MSDHGDLLDPCPATPNCVSSLAGRDSQRVAPLVVNGDPDAAMHTLREVVESLPRTRVKAFSPEGMHVVFTSRILRFRDDVEFALAREDGVIHVRSASRVGHSDLGANRRRVEHLRALLSQENSAAE